MKIQIENEDVNAQFYFKENEAKIKQFFHLRHMTLSFAFVRPFIEFLTNKAKRIFPEKVVSERGRWGGLSISIRL